MRFRACAACKTLRLPTRDGRCGTCGRTLSASQDAGHQTHRLTTNNVGSASSRRIKKTSIFAVMCGQLARSAVVFPLALVLLAVGLPDSILTGLGIAAVANLFGGFVCAATAQRAQVLNALICGLVAFVPVRLVQVSMFPISTLVALGIFDLGFFCLGGWFEKQLSTSRFGRPQKRTWTYTTRRGIPLQLETTSRSVPQATMYFVLAGLFGLWTIPQFIQVILRSITIDDSTGPAFIAGFPGVLLASEQLVSVFSTAVICYLLGRKRSLPRGLSLKGDRIDSTVLYLRSFADDGLKPVQGWWEEFFNAVGMLFSKTNEQRIQRAFREIGQLVAIGRPEEELPEFGAERVYVPDDSWKEFVLDRASRSQAVLLQAGETEGLRWEVSMLEHRVAAEKLLLFIPFPLRLLSGRREMQYARFRCWADDLLPAPLPERINNCFFLYFTSDRDRWNTHQLLPNAKIPGDLPLHHVLRTLSRDRAFWTIRRRLMRNPLVLCLLLLLLPLLCLAIASALFQQS